LTVSPSSFPNRARAKGESCESVPRAGVGFVLADDPEGNKVADVIKLGTD
jgi:hypothetical protein